MVLCKAIYNEKKEMASLNQPKQKIQNANFSTFLTFSKAQNSRRELKFSLIIAFGWSGNAHKWVQHRWRIVGYRSTFYTGPHTNQTHLQRSNLCLPLFPSVHQNILERLQAVFWVTFDKNKGMCKYLDLRYLLWWNWEMYITTLQRIICINKHEFI